MARKSKLATEEVTSVDSANVGDISTHNENLAETGNSPMQSDENSQPEYTAQYHSRCGGALRLAREKSGLSIHDVASRLRLSTKQIEAIEADNFAVLPEPTIIRGFIRNYAKQLKIDAEPLLDAYKVIVPDKSPHAFAIKPSSTMQVSDYTKPKMGRYIWGGFVLLVGLGAWLFYQHYVQKPSPSIPTAGVNAIEPLPQPALPAAERLELPPVPTDATIELSLPPAASADTNISASTLPDNAGVASSATANLPPVNLQLTPNAAAASTQSIITQPVAAQPVVTQPLVGDGKAKLEFNANKETWVSVIDASGREIYNKTIFAGSRESITVKPPVSVVVGNAAGASMTMNSKPIDLAPHTHSNVARVKLE